MAELRNVKVTFERVQDGGRNAANEPLPSEPVTLGTSWAAQKELSESEKVEAGQEVAKRVARFYVRSNQVTRDLGPRDLVRVSPQEAWDITGILPDDGGRRRGFAITAVRRSDG